MKNLIIATDSPCGISVEERKKLMIECVEMSYYIDDEEFGGDTGKSVEAEIFYKAMKAGSKTRTSQITEYQAKNFFERLLKNNKDILYVSFSSQLSGSFNACKNVADELNAKGANKIYVVDSLAGSGGQALFIKMLIEKTKQTDKISEILEYANSLSKRIANIFTLDNLKYLARGGRISHSAALLGNILNIKPIIETNGEGKLIQISKVLFRKKSVQKLVELFKERYSGESEIVYVGYADCEDEADYLVSELEKVAKIKIEKQSITYVLGCHCGPGCLAIFFTQKR